MGIWFIYIVHQYVRSQQARFRLRLMIRPKSLVDQLDWSFPIEFI